MYSYYKWYAKTWKPQIDGFCLSVLHILGQEIQCSWRQGYYGILLLEITMHSMRTSVLHSTVVSGYYVFKVNYYMLLLLKFTMVTMYLYYKSIPKTEAIN